MKKLILVGLIWLSACTTVEAEVLATPTVTPLPPPVVTAVLAETPTTETTQSPTATLIPTPALYDPVNPYRFGTADNYIEFQDSIYTEMATGFGYSWIAPELYTGGAILDQLERCSHDALIANAYDGNSQNAVLYKLIMYLHSGIGSCGVANPANFLRIFLEGDSWWAPDLENRGQQVSRLTGQELCFEQNTGRVCLAIVEIALIPEQDWYTGCESGRCGGSLERFFPQTGSQPGVHEIYLIFCSAERIDGLRPKFILRLQPVITDQSEP